MQLAFFCPQDHHQPQIYIPLFWLDLERWFSPRQSNRLNTLATYPVPNFFDQLKSFQVFKLPRSPGCSNSRSSYVDSIDDFRAAFSRTQNALSFALTITFPKPEDQLWIVNNEAVRYPLCDERRKVTCVWFLQRPGI